MNGGKIPQAVAAGIASALCGFSFFIGGPLAVLLSLVAAVPLYMVGLSLGPAYALLGAAAGTVLVAVLWLPTLPVFLLMMAIPAVVLSWAALTPLDLNGSGTAQRPESGALLALIVGYAIAIITVAGFAFAGHEGGLTGLMLATMREPLQELMSAMDVGTSPEEVEMLAEYMAMSLPAAFAVYWVVWTIANIGIANALLRRLGTTLRTDFNVLTVTPPAWTSIAFVGLVAVSFVAETTLEGSVTAMVARNAVILMVLIFFLVGVSVVHVITIGRPARGLILTLFYGLVLVSVWLALVVAGLGIIEQWARLREKTLRNRPDEED